MQTIQIYKCVSVAAAAAAYRSLAKSASSTNSSSTMGDEAPATHMPASGASSCPEQQVQGQELIPEHEQHQGNHNSSSSSSSRDEVSPSKGHAVPPARPTGTLQDMDKIDLVTKRNQILWDQAVRGQQPGLTLMQDKLGDNRQEEWGNQPSFMEPDTQN